MENDFDFGGWATRANLRCSDGRTIMKDAFKGDHGKTVPLVWNHQHDSPESVLGHALLENREDGVYAYCKFNSTAKGQDAKIQVEHGDITALSIFANGLKEEGKKVFHGNIREVSLVLAGANPGACIDSIIVHADGSCGEDRDQGIIYTGEEIELFHAEDPNTENPGASDGGDENPDETLLDVFNTLTDKQKVVVCAMMDQIISNDDTTDEQSENDEEENNMKHNVFDKSTEKDQVLMHSDTQEILTLAKSKNCGSLRSAMAIYQAEHSEELAHNGIKNEADFYEALFPEVKDLNPGAPELITEDQSWVASVLNGAHKSPISRVRTRQVDVRNIDNLRAKGYKKGSKKALRGDPTLVHRSTDPQTVYVRSDLKRDDVVDITDFDVAAYMYAIDQMTLKEELATAVTIGDGRELEDDQKISPDHIRPIWTDDELYTLHFDVNFAKMKSELQGTDTSKYFGDNYVWAEAIVETLLNARKHYRGSGRPKFYCTTDLVNKMLLARDRNGLRIYNTINDIKSALNVVEVVTVEKFENQVRTTTDGKKKQLMGIFVDMRDYNIGATKGGEVTHFTGFDINFNLLQSLLETRVSGALTRVASAIVLEEDITDGGASSVASSGDDAV